MLLYGSFLRKGSALMRTRKLLAVAACTALLLGGSAQTARALFFTLDASITLDAASQIGNPPSGGIEWCRPWEGEGEPFGRKTFSAISAI